MRLKDKAILVTGAASGMGRVACRMFCEQGAKVLAFDLQQEPLDKMVTELREKGFIVESVVGSVTNSEQVKQAVDQAVSSFGGLHVLYNNAGIMPDDDTSVIETAEDAYQRVIDVNVKGVFLCCKHGIPQLQKAGGGSVVNIASFVALMGCTNPQDAYTASKGAVLSLTRSLAVQYGRHNIRANAVCPGPIETPLLRELLKDPDKRALRLNRIPLGRFGTEEDVVNAGIFLASDESAWITGTTFVVDGGITVNYF